MMGLLYEDARTLSCYKKLQLGCVSKLLPISTVIIFIVIWLLNNMKKTLLLKANSLKTEFWAILILSFI